MNILKQFRPADLNDPSTSSGAIFYAVIFFFAAWLLGRALHLAVQKFLGRDKNDHHDHMAVKFVAQLARYGVYVFAFISYAHVVPALSRLATAWLASIGIISVVAGLAAQNTLGNLVAGISLLLYRPFKLGDRLQLSAPTGLETGIVERLTLGFTSLKTDDNRRVVVPNSVMANQTTVNLTAKDPRVICSVPIGISYDADIDQARGILLALARKNPRAGQVCGCPVTQLTPTSVLLTLQAWCSDALTANDFKSSMLEEVKKRFSKEGIQIPFPQITVMLDREPRLKPNGETEVNRAMEGKSNWVQP